MATPAHLAVALAGLAAAQNDYLEAARFYDGTEEEVFASTKLKALIGGTGGRFRVNYARTPVDVMVERTTIQGLSSADQSAQELCQQAWDDNQLGIEFKDLARRAYEYGDGYLIGWADDEAQSGVSAYAHDPTNVRVFYDPEKPRRKTHAVHRWQEQTVTPDGRQGTVWRVNLYYPDRVEQYISDPQMGKPDGRNTSTDVDLPPVEFGPYVSEDSDEDGVIANPWDVDFLPVFHFRTGRPYGRPEHKDAYGPQNIITKLMVALTAIIEHQIANQRWVTTDSYLDGKAGNKPDIFDDPTDTTPDLADIEGGDGTLTAGPGTLLKFSGQNVKVGEFQAAGTANLIEATNAQIKYMASVTDMPANRFERVGNAPSGEAYRMDEVPLNKKVDDREAQFGVTLKEWHDFVQVVNGRTPVEVTVEWAPPETYSDLTDWQAAQLQLTAGVPLEQVLLERGYDRDKIDEWVKAKARLDAKAKAAQAAQLAALNSAQNAAQQSSPTGEQTRDEQQTDDRATTRQAERPRVTG